MKFINIFQIFSDKKNKPCMEHYHENDQKFEHWTDKDLLAAMDFIHNLTDVDEPVLNSHYTRRKIWKDRRVRRIKKINLSQW